MFSLHAVNPLALACVLNVCDYVYAVNLLAMASNQVVMGSHLDAMASNLSAMASNLTFLLNLNMT